MFFIDSVNRLASGKWLLALQGHPTFIMDFLTVGQPDPRDPQALLPRERDLTKVSLHALHGYGVTVVSLETGREYPVDVVHAEPHPNMRIVLRDKAVPFAQSGLHPGDKAFVVRHRPGDRVIIPLAKSYSP